MTLETCIVLHDRNNRQISVSSQGLSSSKRQTSSGGKTHIVDGFENNKLITMACCGRGVENSVAEQPRPLGSDGVKEKTVSPTLLKSNPPNAAGGSASSPIAISHPASMPPPASTPSQELVVPMSSDSSAPASAAPQANVSVREEPKPEWSTAEKSKEGTTAKANAVDVVAPGARPAKNVPAGYVSGTRKDQEISSGVQDRIAGLKASGLATNNTGGKRMKTPRIITDTKESWDREGNITRELTRYITEPDGTKRTEKETIYIPAAEAQQTQQQE
jgi:hypothetical protein